MKIDPRRIKVMDDDMAKVLRRKTPAERLAMVDGMWRFAGELIRGALRTQHPDWDEAQIQRETARRISHGAVDVVPCLHR